MNKNLIVGLIVLLVVAIGGFFLLKKSIVSGASTLGSASDAQNNTVPASGEVTVKITSSGFSPASLTIKAGTKVTWVNESGDMANVSSDPHPIHTDYPPLNLGNINSGGSASLVFDKPGTYGYHNHLDPSQTGKIIVE